MLQPQRQGGQVSFEAILLCVFAALAIVVGLSALSQRVEGGLAAAACRLTDFASVSRGGCAAAVKVAAASEPAVLAQSGSPAAAVVTSAETARAAAATTDGAPAAMTPLLRYFDIPADTYAGLSGRLETTGTTLAPMLTGYRALSEHLRVQGPNGPHFARFLQNEVRAAVSGLGPAVSELIDDTLAEGRAPYAARWNGNHALGDEFGRVHDLARGLLLHLNTNGDREYASAAMRVKAAEAFGTPLSVMVDNNVDMALREALAGKDAAGFAAAIATYTGRPAAEPLFDIETERTASINDTLAAFGLDRPQFLVGPDQEIEAQAQLGILAMVAVMVAPYVGTPASVPPDANDLFGSRDAMVSTLKLAGVVPADYPDDLAVWDRLFAFVGLAGAPFGVHGLGKLRKVSRLRLPENVDPDDLLELGMKLLSRRESGCKVAGAACANNRATMTADDAAALPAFPDHVGPAAVEWFDQFDDPTDIAIAHRLLSESDPGLVRQLAFMPSRFNLALRTVRSGVLSSEVAARLPNQALVLISANASSLERSDFVHRATLPRSYPDLDSYQQELHRLEQYLAGLPPGPYADAVNARAVRMRQRVDAVELWQELERALADPDLAAELWDGLRPLLSHSTEVPSQLPHVSGQRRTVNSLGRDAVRRIRESRFGREYFLGRRYRSNFMRGFLNSLPGKWHELEAKYGRMDIPSGEKRRRVVADVLAYYESRWQAYREAFNHGTDMADGSFRPGLGRRIGVQLGPDVPPLDEGGVPNTFEEVTERLSAHITQVRTGRPAYDSPWGDYSAGTFGEAGETRVFPVRRDWFREGDSGQRVAATLFHEGDHAEGGRFQYRGLGQLPPWQRNDQVAQNLLGEVFAFIITTEGKEDGAALALIESFRDGAAGTERLEQFVTDIFEKYAEGGTSAQFFAASDAAESPVAIVSNLLELHLHELDELVFRPHLRPTFDPTHAFTGFGPRQLDEAFEARGWTSETLDEVLELQAEPALRELLTQMTPAEIAQFRRLAGFADGDAAAAAQLSPAVAELLWTHQRFLPVPYFGWRDLNVLSADQLQVLYENPEYLSLLPRLSRPQTRAIDEDALATAEHFFRVFDPVGGNGFVQDATFESMRLALDLVSMGALPADVARLGHDGMLTALRELNAGRAMPLPLRTEALGAGLFQTARFHGYESGEFGRVTSTMSDFHMTDAIQHDVDTQRLINLGLPESDVQGMTPDELRNFRLWYRAENLGVPERVRAELAANLARDRHGQSILTMAERHPHFFSGRPVVNLSDEGRQTPSWDQMVIDLQLFGADGSQLRQLHRDHVEVLWSMRLHGLDAPETNEVLENLMTGRGLDGFGRDVFAEVVGDLRSFGRPVEGPLGKGTPALGGWNAPMPQDAFWRAGGPGSLPPNGQAFVQQDGQVFVYRRLGDTDEIAIIPQGLPRRGN